LNEILDIGIWNEWKEIFEYIFGEFWELIWRILGINLGIVGKIFGEFLERILQDFWKIYYWELLYQSGILLSQTILSFFLNSNKNTLFVENKIRKVTVTTFTTADEDVNESATENDGEAILVGKQSGEVPTKILDPQAEQRSPVEPELTVKFGDNEWSHPFDLINKSWIGFNSNTESNLI